jgi:hypothetical protein
LWLLVPPPSSEQAVKDSTKAKMIKNAVNLLFISNLPGNDFIIAFMS